MSEITIGIIGILLLLITLVSGMPIGIGMAIVGLVGFSYLRSVDAGFSLIARDAWIILSAHSLTVIPMFVLMGSIAFVSGASRRLYDAVYTVVGRFPGGLAMASIGTCAAFAAICGSTSATVAAVGKIALPEMRKYNYKDSLSTGCVAAAGSLGILIPPSTILIIYGILTEQSITQLFLAGILPGVLLSILMILVVVVLVWRNPAIAPAGARTTWKEKLAGLVKMVDMTALFALCMGGLFLGWFSPTQAGTVGAAGALLIALIRRSISWGKLMEAVRESLTVTAMAMVIVIGATIFGRFIALSRIPMFLAIWLSDLVIPKAAIMGILVLIYLIGGLFMDSLALLILTVPIFYPAVVALGFDPIWFGVLIVLVTEMGVITPPVGINVYVMKTIAQDIPLETIFKGIFPFLAALVIEVGILIAFPQIATLLPGVFGY